MKNFTKRILAAALAAMMLFSFASCANIADPEAETTAASVAPAQTTLAIEETTADPAEVFELPAESQEYAGKLVILNSSGLTAVGLDDTSADMLDQAVFRRNAIMSERYGVEVSEIVVKSSQAATTAENEISSGDPSFDVAMLNYTNSTALARKGLWYDLASINNISLEKSWWDQSANLNYRFGDHLYYTYSNMVTSHFDHVRCFYFNHTIMADNNLSVDELYQKAIDGNWTLEEMYNYAKDIYKDNGNGVADKDDLYPVVGVPSTTYSALCSGADASYIKIDPKTSLPYAYFTTEGFVNAYNLILDTMSGENFFYTGCAKNTEATDMFVNGHALFLMTTISNSNTMRSGMKDDFGFLPLPKRDTDQEHYTCNAPNPYSIAVPACVKDPERIGFILEAMAYHSTETVRSTYFEIRLYGQTSRDALSWQTLDLIYSNIAYSIPVQSTISYSSKINDMMVEGSRDISSYIASVKTSMEKDIENFINGVQ